MKINIILTKLFLLKDIPVSRNIKMFFVLIYAVLKICPFPEIFSNYRNDEDAVKEIKFSTLKVAKSLPKPRKTGTFERSRELYEMVFIALLLRSYLLRGQIAE